MSKRNTSMVAVGLEVGPGTLLGLFGIGHLYQGRYGAGLMIMVSYWLLQSLIYGLFGFGWLWLIGTTLTWLAYAVVSSTDVLRE